MLVRERVLASGVENDERTIRNDGGEFVEMDRVHAVAATADSDCAEILRRLGLDDAVNVFAVFGFGLIGLRLFAHRIASGETRKAYNTSNMPSQRAATVEAWFRKHQRFLPWRAAYEPYHVWVSEVMLQQTRMEVVLGYYEKFLERFPTVASLAAASDDEVTSAWSGLGYYRRARMLRDGARDVMQRFGGRVPSTVEELLT